MHLHRAALLLAVLTVAAPASAHSGHAESFVSAFAHPLLGWDHLLAMLLVGLLAARMGGRSGAWLPVAFVGGGAMGYVVAAVSATMLAPAWLEPSLSAGVVLLGCALASTARVSKQVSIATTALACVFIGALHGAAHGVEVQGAMSIVAAGLLTATAALHAAGYAAGRLLRARAAYALRAVGVGSAFAGCAALITRIA
jgi:urease accessory protein